MNLTMRMLFCLDSADCSLLETGVQLMTELILLLGKGRMPFLSNVVTSVGCRGRSPSITWLVYLKKYFTLNHLILHEHPHRHTDILYSGTRRDVAGYFPSEDNANCEQKTVENPAHNDLGSNIWKTV